MFVSIIQKNNVKYLDKKKMLYPNQKYPELDLDYDHFESENVIFEMVRENFHILKLDEKNYNTKKWNPLGMIIKKGDTVLLKPNMVLEKNLNDKDSEECLYTHPNVIVPILYYVCKALQKTGKIIVADAPVQQCNFDVLIQKSGYQDVVNFFKSKGFNIELKDLRGLKSFKKDGNMIQEIVTSNGIVVDLAENSEHASVSSNMVCKYRITNYDPNELLKHHSEQKHEYCISEDVLNADVIINIPKPKAHRKAGVTIGLKNFVGVNVRKEYLPHHKMGDLQHGGDEYLNSSSLLYVSSKMKDCSNKLMKSQNYFLAKSIKYFANIFSGIDKRFGSKETFREGSWYGNDTIWRTILDINKIVMYASKSGKMCDVPQRVIFNIADMIVVGEKEGPLLPSSKYGGVIAMANNTAIFDKVLATIMGFDIKKIPTFINLQQVDKYSLLDEKYDYEIVSNNNFWNQKKLGAISKENTLQIKPSKGWKNHIELK